MAQTITVLQTELIGMLCEELHWDVDFAEMVRLSEDEAGDVILLLCQFVFHKRPISVSPETAGPVLERIAPQSELKLRALSV